MPRERKRLRNRPRNPVDSRSPGQKLPYKASTREARRGRTYPLCTFNSSSLERSSLHFGSRHPAFKHARRSRKVNLAAVTFRLHRSAGYPPMLQQQRIDKKKATRIVGRCRDEDTGGGRRSARQYICQRPVNRK